MLQSEFQQWLDDNSKIISGDISWTTDTDHPRWVEFRAMIQSDDGSPVSVKGSFNSTLKRLSFSVIHRSFGRIYGLDLGREHRNFDKSLIGETHKHFWDEETRSAHDAYEPQDITADGSNPMIAWAQFCSECTIRHVGVMVPPPGFGQANLFT